MPVQYIEQDLKLIYSILKGGEFYDNYSDVENSPLGKLLISLREMDQELGYSKIKEIEDPQAHEEAFQKVAFKLHEDELQQKIEKLRKSVQRKHKYKKRSQ